jgi:hypothetical protein
MPRGESVGATAPLSVAAGGAPLNTGGAAAVDDGKAVEGVTTKQKEEWIIW